MNRTEVIDDFLRDTGAKNIDSLTEKNIIRLYKLIELMTGVHCPPISYVYEERKGQERHKFAQLVKKCLKEGKVIRVIHYDLESAFGPVPEGTYEYDYTVE